MERNRSIHNLPPGFRFQPSDQELILHYLTNKLTSTPLPAPVIADINLYHFDPWHLPGKALYGEEEWYFFTPRDRKYPNGARPNRAAVSGYWKATGIDKPIFSTTSSPPNLNIIIGLKKALVFYNGRPPKGVKTDWIMHEYRLQKHPTNNSNSMRLDDWVLCRVRRKTIAIRNIWEDDSTTHHLSSGISSSSSYSQETTASLLLLSPGTQSNPEQLPLLPYLFDPPDFSSFQTNLMNNMSSNGEKKQITASPAMRMFDASTAYSDDDPTSIISFHCSSSSSSSSRSCLWYPEVEQGQSIPGNSNEPFTPSNANNNPPMNLIDIDQTQVLQSIMADPWRPL